MVILGLVLIALGALAIVSAVFVSEGNAELLGMNLTALEIFLFGVAAGACLLWGFAVLKYGAKRGLQTRRERKELQELNAKLDRVEAERRTEENS